MWKIRHIFDGDYGCEGRLSGQLPKVSVTLTDEKGNERYAITGTFTFLICIFI